MMVAHQILAGKIGEVLVDQLQINSNGTKAHSDISRFGYI
jgi:hypothetical protein